MNFRIIGLNVLAHDIHQNALNKGFWEQSQFLGYTNDAAIRVALVHSECSELLEAIRKNIKTSEHVPEITGAEEECADTIIRLLDMAAGYGWDIEKSIELKMNYNLGRGHMHGNKAF